MPYKRKDSPVWHASFPGPNGKRIRRSTGTTDRQEAAALEAKWKLEGFKAKQWGEQPSHTFDELMVGYLRHSRATKRPWGHRRDLDATRHLREHFGGMGLRDLSPALVRAYIDIRRDQVSPSTVNRELCVLSAAINHARIEWEWDVSNPVAGRKLREPEGRVRWITRAEASRLIEMAGRESQARHLPDFIRLALNTGCRKGELLQLEWGRVDLQAGLIHLEAGHTKTKRRRSVPLNADAREAILSRLRFRAQLCPASQWVFCREDGGRIADVKRSFAKACERAGITDFRIHDLRHTCAAWLVSAGADLVEVRDLLGHSTINMTERYAHLAPENVRAAVKLLEGGLSHGRHTEKLTIAG